MIKLKENELYQEIEITDNGVKVGEMEVDLKGKMLSRLIIYEPYRNKGYGTQAVRMAKELYGCDCLWVRADNDQAIHVYEKLGFVKQSPTMYLMEIPAEEGMNYCETCISNPPSSCDGKPCTQCEPEDPLYRCYVKKEGEK